MFFLQRVARGVVSSILINRGVVEGVEEARDDLGVHNLPADRSMEPVVVEGHEQGLHQGSAKEVVC